jgi:hypothetical protein
MRNQKRKIRNFRTRDFEAKDWTSEVQKTVKVQTKTASQDRLSSNYSCVTKPAF